MKSMMAEDYFTAHADEAQVAFRNPVTTAREVTKGQQYVCNSEILPGFYVQAEADGWLIGRFDGEMRGEIFITKQKFPELFIAETQIERQIITPRWKVTPVKIGQTAVVFQSGCSVFGVRKHVDQNGFLVASPEAPDKPRFFTNEQFEQTFRQPGDSAANTITLCRLRGLDAKERKISMLVLKEPVTFAFKMGIYTAKAGDVLYVNPKSEDGYTLITSQQAKELFDVPAAKLPQAQPNIKGQNIQFE